MTDEIRKNELNEEQLENVSGGAGAPQGQQALYYVGQLALYNVGQQVIVTIRDKIRLDGIPVDRQEKAEIVSVSFGDYQRSFFEPGVSGAFGQGYIYNVRYLSACSYPTNDIPECFVQPV